MELHRGRSCRWGKEGGENQNRSRRSSRGWGCKESKNRSPEMTNRGWLELGKMVVAAAMGKKWERATVWGLAHHLKVEEVGECGAG